MVSILYMQGGTADEWDRARRRPTWKPSVAERGLCCSGKELGRALEKRHGEKIGADAGVAKWGHKQCNWGRASGQRKTPEREGAAHTQENGG